MTTLPPRAEVTDNVGFQCRPAEHNGYHPRHTGCPGWWSDVIPNEYDGWLCACSCHADGAGWPGYESARTSVTA